jgi:myo-inositol 2-dehydrogenase/D-chiro-inositol 1-dehydrogenase/scyllo-inositol 2-dehydrogenase (NAD+)
VKKPRSDRKRGSGGRIRLGLIGCGSIAQESHLPAIRKIPEIDLVAVADSDESKAQQVGREYKVAGVYKDYRQLLESGQVDAVDICTPTKYHAEMVIAAANLGKHVLCEKPIALHLEEADQMIQACSKNNVKLMIAHSRRFISRYSIVKKNIKERRIGKPVWATQISRRHTIDPNRYTWYFDPKMTYGPIAEVGTHEADLLRWFFEDEVVEVQGIARSRSPDMPLYEQVFATLAFRKGGIASFEVGYCLPKSYTQYTTLEVLGTAGFITASDRHMNIVIEGTDRGARYPLANSVLLSVANAYRDELIAFADSVIRNRKPPVTGTDGRSALEIILAVLQSVEQRAAVQLPLLQAN